MTHSHEGFCKFNALFFFSLFYPFHIVLRFNPVSCLCLWQTVFILHWKFLGTHMRKECYFMISVDVHLFMVQRDTNLLWIEHFQCYFVVHFEQQDANNYRIHVYEVPLVQFKRIKISQNYFSRKFRTLKMFSIFI